MRVPALPIAALVLVGACVAPGAGSSPAIDRTDARFTACAGDAAPIMAAFPMAAASDYRAHIPKMGLSPELDVSTPAFVVVFEGMYPGGPYQAVPPPSGTTWPPRSLAPGTHDLCIWVGDVGSGERNVYSDVDTAGMVP
jgi:hypothetical protein